MHTMDKNNKKEFRIEGLNCANCAAKIEKGIQDIDGVSVATLNFSSQTLTLHLQDGQDTAKIFKEASTLADHIEAGVAFVDKEDVGEGDHVDRLLNPGELAILGLGVIVFATAIIGSFQPYTEFGLYFSAYLLIGGEVLLRAGKNIVRGQVFDENFLMSIATIGAFAIGEYAEGVAVMLFYQVGELFQDLAVNRSRRSIKELLDIKPEYANLIEGSQSRRVKPDEVTVGSRILVKPGEKVPLDGVVVEGTSMVDTMALTGESLPRDIQEGDVILSGFINQNSLLTVEVTKAYADSTVAKILDLVENASSKKAPTENFITTFAKYYTPVVVFSALALAFIPPLITGGNFYDWIYRALIFLVVSCPCALVISIPLGFFGGIGGASRHGILIKGSNYLEALNKVDTVVFDKTGTLTHGFFEVTHRVPEAKAKLSEDELLRYAAIGEIHSNHPIGLSILKAYGEPLDESQITHYEDFAGKGAKVHYADDVIIVGNNKMMHAMAIEFEEVDSLGTVVYIAVNNQYCGYLEIQDTVKKDSASTIKALGKLGIRHIIMLTGDRKEVGQAVGNSLGITDIRSELLPADKVTELEAIVDAKEASKRVIFVGDGVNDAPVLARADIGVAMGGLGSDVAIEAADIVLMTDEPSKLVTAIHIAKRTKRIVWQNIIFALGVKGIVLLMGAAGIATMWEAVFADVGVAFIAVINAMRVMNMKKEG